MIRTLLHTPALWIGLILGPIAWYLVIKIIRGVYMLITQWLMGLPLVQWPAMMLVVLGCKFLRDPKYCQFMRYNDRFWISPGVSGFEIMPENETVGR